MAIELLKAKTSRLTPEESGKDIGGTLKEEL
jgi:hypothetical protein